MIFKGQIEKTLPWEPEVKVEPSHVWRRVGHPVTAQKACPRGSGQGVKCNMFSFMVDGWVCLSPSLAGVSENSSVDRVRR